MDDSQHNTPESQLDAPDELLRATLGDGYEQLERFHRLLCDQGVLRGLIGPREVPRLWQRHLLNSAAVAELVPEEGILVDVGTGAGLPGVVLAVLRPHLRVVLLEPMERRVAWLGEIVGVLGLANTEVLRGRAEELGSRLEVDVATARAVAPMDRLAAWCLPLLRTGGVLLAMKGEQAAVELAASQQVIAAYGGDAGEVVPVRLAPGHEPTTVVRVTRERAVLPPPTRRSSRRRPT